MAKAATKKPATKKPRKPKGELTSGGFSPEFTQPDRPKVQKAIEGAFAPEDERLEELVDSFLKSKNAVVKAQDKKTTAYDALKEEMRDQGLTTYYCYRTRKRVLLAPEDAKVKVEDVKEDDATPFSPSKANPE